MNNINNFKLKILNNNKNEEISILQKDAVINFGKTPISTYNLVNCIAIGGVFDNNGTFLTHESPTDYMDLQYKLKEIQTILNNKQVIIQKIIIFYTDKPSTSIYKDNLTTKKIITIMQKFCNIEFNIIPIMKTYSYDSSTLHFGKIIISPFMYNTTLQFFTFIENISKDRLSINKNVSNESFNVDTLYNTKNEKIYQCPECKNITGTYAPIFPHNTYYFAHLYNCINTNKIPIEK